MTTHTDDVSAGLKCHICGYDLRAHPEDGRCPECGESVAESRREAAIPRRPAWRESDPRWRRRVLAGVWVLVLLPLMDVLMASGWAAKVPVPTVFNYRGTVQTIDDTFLSWPGVFQPLVFCIGVVLLFSKERGRRRFRLDWTRRWGILSSYAVLLLSAAEVLLISALVLAGIAALFIAMPLKQQPHVTQFFVHVSTGYLWYGAYPTPMSGVMLVAFSSIVMLLACVPLFNALRSNGSKWAAAILLAPLALFALIHLAQAGRCCIGFSTLTFAEVPSNEVYFWPALLVRDFRGGDRSLFYFRNVSQAAPLAFYMEVAKWCIVVVIAVWLSVAQVAASLANKRGLNSTHTNAPER